MKFVHALFAAFIAALLAACGGGSYDSDPEVPVGAAQCQLKEEPASSLLPRFDVYLPGASIPQLPGRYLFAPEPLFAEGLPFHFQANFVFPAMPPQPEERLYVVYVQEWLYHAGPVPRQQCVLTGLRDTDWVTVVGNIGAPRTFVVTMWATVTLPDGRVVASQPTFFTVKL